jgi:transposase
LTVYPISRFHQSNYPPWLDINEKAAIVAFVEAGWSNKAIAQRIGCDNKTVAKWKNRFEETGDISRKVGSGAKRITTQEEDTRLRDAVSARPITTALEIAGSTYIFLIILVY